MFKKVLGFDGCWAAYSVVKTPSYYYCYYSLIILNLLATLLIEESLLLFVITELRGSLLEGKFWVRAKVPGRVPMKLPKARILFGCPIGPI